MYEKLARRRSILSLFLVIAALGGGLSAAQRDPSPPEASAAQRAAEGTGSGAAAPSSASATADAARAPADEPRLRDRTAHSVRDALASQAAPRDSANGSVQAGRVPLADPRAGASPAGEVPEARATPTQRVRVTLDYGPAGRRPLGREVDFRPGMTALDAVREIAAVVLTDSDPTHPMAVEAIDGVRTDLPRSLFWVFDVNGEHATRMAHEVLLEPGDVVAWTYLAPPITVRVDFGPAGREALEAQVRYRDGMTVLDALREAAEVGLSDADPGHPRAVASVAGVETDLERGWFWLYWVNGRHPQFMADRFFVKPGYEVEWRLTAPEDRPVDEPAEASHDAAPTAQQSEVEALQRAGAAQGLAGAIAR
ncbi:MAG: DUF4430 domain-containing protein [Planctomycetota bacterium]|nr:MAG: DUF4430 domain-containing protein [Planctomycetota bacterium]